MITTDQQKWADSTTEQIREIAKTWSKKYTTKQLRAFQEFYQSTLRKLPVLTLDELKGKITDNTIEYDGYCNMLECASLAVGMKEFKK
jgi:hypothetical protein